MSDHGNVYVCTRKDSRCGFCPIRNFIMCSCCPVIRYLYLFSNSDELLGRLNWFSQQIVKWNLGAMLASGVFAAVQLICVISGPKSLINRNFIYTYLVAFISTIFLTLNYRNYIIKVLLT